MLFAAMIRFTEGLSLETLLSAEREKSLFFLVDTRRSAVSTKATVEFVLENITVNGASRCYCLE
jgi:hypothetical protein